MGGLFNPWEYEAPTSSIQKIEQFFEGGWLAKLLNSIRCTHCSEFIPDGCTAYCFVGVLEQKVKAAICRDCLVENFPGATVLQEALQRRPCGKEEACTAWHLTKKLV